MSKTHWKKTMNPDYLGAYALEPGQEMILTIKHIQEETVTGPDGKKEQCSVIHFVERVKPMILNATNAKTIAKVTGSPYIEDWYGRKIQVYSATVRAFGEMVDALRVREFAPREADIICHDCQKPITAAFSLPAEEIAERSKKTYGVELCASCSQQRKKKADWVKAQEDAIRPVSETQTLAAEPTEEQKQEMENYSSSEEHAESEKGQSDEG